MEVLVFSESGLLNDVIAIARTLPFGVSLVRILPSTADRLLVIQRRRRSSGKALFAASRDGPPKAVIWPSLLLAMQPYLLLVLPTLPRCCS